MHYALYDDVNGVKTESLLTDDEEFSIVLNKALDWRMFNKYLS